MKFKGGCHCGDVRFEIEAPEQIEAIDCNCSICRKTGFLHLILPIDKFKITKGEGNLKTYKFNTGVAKHYFCNTCGIKSFYVPRSNPDGIDVNVRCIDDQPRDIRITPFDGVNWEANASTLAHKSKML